MVSWGGAGRTLGVFLFNLLLRLGSISCDSIPVYAAVNKSVTFHPSHHMPFKEILWKKQKNKVIEWENSEFKAFPPFIDRVHLDPVSGNLTIFNLTSSDEDEYEIESPSITSTTKFFLYVIEPISSLTLTCMLMEQNITVQCEIPEYDNSHPGLLKYSWNCPSEQCKDNSASEMHFDMESDQSQKIQCTVSNEVSTKTSSITLATCFGKGFDFSRNRIFLAISVVFVLIVSILLLFYLATRR
ncbi:lymphocyte function-associated antigen 3 [Eulemur rufifrons]|uniref:lymphocyte function-associated antigen 3 n=1 Tax=Eulemur rufifrons TaxID=859984 RepID=UPI0037433152